MNTLFHRILTALAAVLLTVTTASAYDFEADGIYYNLVRDEAIVTYGEQKYTGDITIPAKVTDNYGEYNVVGVGNEAFNNCQITSVNLPEGLKTVGKKAFRMTPIRNISLPPTLEYIGFGAFWGSDITDLIIPSNVTYLGKRAFTCCENLTNVVMDCQTAGSDLYHGSCVMFENCPNLRTMRVAGSIQTLQGAFILNAKNMCEIYIGENVKYLSSTTFLNTGVQDIYFMSPNPPEFKYSDFTDIIEGEYPLYPDYLYTIIDCVNVHIPEGTLEAYRRSKLMNYLPANVNFIEDAASIDETVADNDTEITVTDGRIKADGLVEVYATDGRLVGRGLSDDLPTLTPGLYIVRTPSTAKKIIVR